MNLLKRWVALDTGRSDIRIELAELLYAKGKKKDAAKLVADAVRLDPSNERARQLLRMVHESDKNAPYRKSSKKKTSSALRNECKPVSDS